MNPLHSIGSARATRWLLAALAALVLASHAPAQPVREERWLLVFDTSWAMKKRLPALEAAVKSFFATGANGRLHAGDSLGVWNFDQRLHSGEFPLATWEPEDAGRLATNLVKFVKGRKYTSTPAFAALQPTLNRVIDDSERLTVVIFCTGTDLLSWSPYNNGINQAFRQNLEERRQSHQPFVLVLRTQRGKFTGSMVNLPPAQLTIPPFPPLPEEIRPVPVSAPAAPMVHVAAKLKPLPAVPALVIVGTNVSTNIADIPKPATNEPVPAPAAMAETNGSASNRVAAAKPGPPPATNHPANPPLKATNPPPAAGPINVPAAATPDAGEADTRVLLLLETGLLLLSFGLVVYLVVRSRNRSRGSLITRSMDQIRRPPNRN